jgi:hypothetical protein
MIRKHTAYLSRSRIRACSMTLKMKETDLAFELRVVTDIAYPTTIMAALKSRGTTRILIRALK